MSIPISRAVGDSGTAVKLCLTRRRARQGRDRRPGDPTRPDRRDVDGVAQPAGSASSTTARPESWWSLLGVLDQRFGLGKAGFFGDWTLPACFVLLLAAGPRRPPPDPGRRGRRMSPRAGGRGAWGAGAPGSRGAREPGSRGRGACGGDTAGGGSGRRGSPPAGPGPDGRLAGLPRRVRERGDLDGRDPTVPGAGRDGALRLRPVRRRDR